MQKKEGVKLIYVCPKCGESIEPILTKKEVKILWKSFKLPLKDREKWSEQQIQKIRRNQK